VTELLWPTEIPGDLRKSIHRVVHAVVADGGAIGYLSPPSQAQVDAWLDEVLTDVRAGNGALVLAQVDGAVQAMGTWLREKPVVFRHSGVIGKVMAHPAARGLGLGRQVMSALIEHARGTDLELLVLGVRGNNHGTIQLYEELGFRESGRLPNRIVVGNDRFDDVQMMLPLGHPPDVRLRGAEPGGPGSTPPRRYRVAPQ
jgi:ribosomal protein S18 acetylase RimI-like enzyme